MKKRLVIIIIVVVILVGLSLGVVVYFKYGQKEEMPLDSKPQELGYHISDINVIDDSNIRYFDDYYIKETNDGFNVYDLDGNVLYKNNTNRTYLVNNEMISLNDENRSYLVDLHGNVVIDDFYYSVYDPINNLYYYVKDDAIYNANDEVVYFLPNSYDYINIYGDLVLIDGEESILINLQDGTTRNYTFFYVIGEYNYILVNSNNQFILYDINTSEIIKIYERYNMFTVNGIYVYELVNGEEIDLIVDYNFIDGERYYLTDDIYADYGACNNGSKLMNGDMAIIDKCYNGFYHLKEDNYLAFRSDFKMDLYKGGELVTTLEEGSAAGSYILVGDYDSTLYNSDGEKIDLNINSITLFKDKYLVSIMDVKFLLDEDLRIDKGPYQEITCNDYACIFKDFDGKRGILIDNEEVVNSKEYLDLELKDNKIIAQVYDKTYIYLISEDENTVDIELEKTNFKTKLQYIVDNNSNIQEFKEEILNLYPLLQKNVDLLDEGYFLESLGRLKIYEDASIGEDYAGLYQDFSKLIRYRDSSDSVIYHELIHFLDYSINDKKNNIYICDNTYLDYESFARLDIAQMEGCQKVNIENANFMTEAGAEITTAKNFVKKITTYSIPCNIYTAFENIFGSLVIDKVFVDSKTDYLLLQLFLDSGFTLDEYQYYVKLFNSYVTNTTNVYKVVDALIEIYEQVKNDSWYEDKEFTYIITAFFGVYDYSNSKYRTELSEHLYTLNFYNILLEKVGPGCFPRMTPFSPYYIDGEFYLDAYVWSSGTPKEILIKYDFDNEVVESYEVLF